MRRTSRQLAVLSVLTAGTLVLSTGAASAEEPVAEPDSFTSMFTASATPESVIGQNNQPAPGQQGATGTFNYRINSDQEIICYDLELSGLTSDYASPAKTATHIHEAQPGRSGPPRIAFPNPSGSGNTKTGSGCLKGPFTTGVMANGQDSGTGFSLKQIEADPAAFFGDTHTQGFTAGAVRGQLARVPMGGVETGAGGLDEGAGTGTVALGAGALLAAGAVGVLAARRGRGRSSR